MLEVVLGTIVRERAMTNEADSTLKIFI
jgi:hypothetical protein